MKIGFIGCGNLALSVIEGMIKYRAAESQDICFYSADSDEVKKGIVDQYGICSLGSNADVVAQSQMIFLAVKPNVLLSVLAELQEANLQGRIFISVVAGVAAEEIKQHLQYDKVLRMMPNILGSVGEGMFVFAEDETLKDELRQAEKLLKKIGKTLRLDEKQLAAVTAISGSAPAYVFMFIEALAQGGIREGISQKAAYDIAAQVVLGSAKMVSESSLHPAQLRDKVCSPAGTTIEAVASLQQDGFSAAVMNAVKRCANKA